MVAGPAELTPIQLTIYTDALVIRGSVQTRARRLVDVFDPGDRRFLLVEEVTMDEHGSRGRATFAPFAHVRLEAILFAYTDASFPDEPDPAPAHPAVMLDLPPFMVAGTVDALPGQKDFREAIADLPAGIIRVAGAGFWSDPLNEGRRQAPFVAVNGARVQVVAPHRDVDPWAGLDLARAAHPAGTGEGGPQVELDAAEEA